MDHLLLALGGILTMGTMILGPIVAVPLALTWDEGQRTRRTIALVFISVLSRFWLAGSVLFLLMSLWPFGADCSGGIGLLHGRPVISCEELQETHNSMVNERLNHFLFALGCLAAMIATKWGLKKLTENTQTAPLPGVIHAGE